MNSVLLLGAMSDIGQALASQYASKGWQVWLAGRNQEKLDLLKSDLEIRTENKEISTFYFDALSFDDHKAFYSSLPGRPDVAILIFGLLGEQESAVSDWNEAKQILDTNFTGAVSILNIIALDMASAGGGTIVGISSVAGDRGRQSNFIYGSSKAGLSAYLSGLRNAMFKKGVHVVTVKPGFVATRMTEHLDLPGPLTAQPEEVAGKIIRSIEKRKNVIYIKWLWRWIMLLIMHIPEFLFKRLKL
jgi:decaprenylphospho-beta-D-erythro-pentofuranosid-2-ulose 2-reductase